MEEIREKQSEAFLGLVEVMDTLRAECPWDRKQTIHTLNNLTVEEVYELVDALSVEDWPNIKEELGDILLHILFY
ncbi:MAG TPA: MazG nucleotide pyrophosphohydrolase domain-containing protein, partial [Chitinophagaceae bacterium]|nr:MazG nucleotide pyrophosphohydrolase domain-containing protein [Chitinophagaceae bacterium]